jgi:hypothetical protein
MGLLCAAALAACSAPRPDVSDAPAYGRAVVKAHVVIAADSCVSAKEVEGRLLVGLAGQSLSGVDETGLETKGNASTYTLYGDDGDVMVASVRAQLADVVLAPGSTLYERRGGPGTAETRSELTTQETTARRCVGSTPSAPPPTFLVLPSVGVTR